MTDVLADLIVDWTTLVTPSARIHILHGGSDDPFGIQNAVQHLQKTWCMSVVMVKTAGHFQNVLQTQDRLPKHVRPIVCVPFTVVAAAPHVYDALVGLDRCTCVVTVPVSKLHGRAYSKRSGIVVVVLPSTRLDLDNVNAVQEVYRFPSVRRVDEDIGPGVDGIETALETTLETDELAGIASSELGKPSVCDDLDRMLWCLPHEYGIAWCVGRSMRPAVIDFANAVTENARRLSEAQTLTDRAWWWSRDAGIIGSLTTLPNTPVGIVVGSEAGPFSPALENQLRRVSHDTLVFAISQTREDIYAARCQPAVASKAYDAHVIDGKDGVVPVRLCLLDAVDTTKMQRGVEVVMLTCRCTFPTVCHATTYHAPRHAWKTYAGTL